MTTHHHPLALAAKHTFASNSRLSLDMIDTPPSKAGLNEATYIGSAALGAMAQNLVLSEDAPIEAHSLAGLDTTGRIKAVEMQELRTVVALRLRAAREVTGLGQVDVAKGIGHENSTQVCLWEAAKRMPPIAEMLKVSDVLGVSLDFLLGRVQDLERDPTIARRTSITRRIELSLTEVAGALADALCTADTDVSGEMRVVGLIGQVTDMADAMARFVCANDATFDDMPAGARLLRCVRDVEAAAIHIGEVMDQVDREREQALRRAQVVLRGRVQNAAQVNISG